MNKDILYYKYRFTSVVLLLGYAFIHTQLSGIYSEVSLEQLIHFSAQLPFGQRLLVPALVNGLTYVFPFTIDELFFLLEWLFISLFYFCLYQLLLLEFNSRQARLLSWLCILLLPLVTVINYRYRVFGGAPFFYPSDTASLFFMTLGFLFCLREKWIYFVPWVFISTLNRESSILLVLLVPALYWHKVHTVIKPIFGALCAYLFARIVVLVLLRDAEGQIMDWYFHMSTHTHFEVNLLWLLEGQNVLLLVFGLAGLPLLWFVLFDYIPLQFRPLRYVTLFYFLALLLVGNVMEPRIFSEILVLLYFPVCLAIRNWLSKQPLIFPNKLGIAYYIDRYAILGIFCFVILFRQFLNHSLITFFIPK
ncbi:MULTISPECIES: hypothetical protein [Legionella]|uniref:Uncharacterized protein n=1 Tax=Legionella maceachernii TaxID=466 RepID=A0A0W0WCR7_9GAMM|nr:hypothetical protein [Legionella maceachernii]KTD30164.1 hypothetical protein Lmac_0661 [Legionella maceachernii]SJZ93244.1 hypothetical protein SAMN02745128_01490 [Legionella maceachernii]SUP03462.1 Uncharacterised protein [Legionella maceachernii]